MLGPRMARRWRSQCAGVASRVPSQCHSCIQKAISIYSDRWKGQTHRPLPVAFLGPVRRAVPSPIQLARCVAYRFGVTCYIRHQKHIPGPKSERKRNRVGTLAWRLHLMQSSRTTGSCLLPFPLPTPFPLTLVPPEPGVPVLVPWLMCSSQHHHKWN